MRKIRSSFLLGVSAVAITAGSGALAAENLKPNSVEEIVITARKREEKLQTVPIAITAVTSKEIGANGAIRVRDLQLSAPNLLFSGAENNSLPFVTVRGISSSARANVGTDGGLGVYVDGVVQGRLTSFNQELGDVARVEFLRGPQGTLFGKNTISGAISIITRQPNLDRMTGDVQLRVADFNEVTARGYLSVPIEAGKSAASISLFKSSYDGYITNVANGHKIGNNDSYGGRGKAYFQISDQFNFTISADALVDNSVAPNSKATTGAFVTPGNFVTNVDQDPISHRKVGGVTGIADYSFKSFPAKLTSVTGWRYTKNYRATDSDASPVQSQITYQFADQTQFSEELRLASTGDGPFSYVAGLYYFNQDSKGQTDGFIKGLGTASIFGPIETDSYAAFANVDYKITNQVTLTAGIRATQEKKTLNFQQTGIARLVPSLPLETDSRTDSDVSPTASLNWQPTTNIMVYGTVSRGFRSGGWNVEPITSFLITSFKGVRFGTENVLSYEGGFKTTWFDNRLLLNGAVFHLDYKNLQVAQRAELPPPFAPGLFASLVTNAGAAKADGAEFEMKGVMDWLEVGGNLGIVTAKYTTYLDTGVSFAGKKLNNAPKYSGGAFAQVNVPETSIGAFSGRISWRYADAYFIERTNDPRNGADKVSLLNLRLAYQPSGSRYEIAAFAENATDKVYAATKTSNAAGTVQSVIYGRPRVMGIELSARF